MKCKNCNCEDLHQLGDWVDEDFDVFICYECGEETKVRKRKPIYKEGLWG